MADKAASVADNPLGTAAGQGVVAPELNPQSEMREQASPEAFGAVGRAVQGLGNTAEELAVKYGGMVNETLANNAESNLSQQIGKVKADYMTKTGMDAYNSYGAYQASIEQAYKDNSQGLTLGAGQAYQMQSRRMVDNHLADGGSYAATQLKEARIDSNSNMQNANMQALTDPSVATNPQRSQFHIDSVAYAEQAKIDESHPGLTTDPDTGKVNFDLSKPEGQQLKAQLQQNIDTAVSQAQVTRFNTLSKPDVMGVLPAYNMYQEMRESMPRQAQVALDSTFAPKVFQAHADNVVGSTLQDAQTAHLQMLYSPSNAGSNPNNLGNVKTPQGAAQGTQEFVNPATPVDGVTLAANTLRNGYQGMTLQQIGQKWTGESAEKVNAWVKNASNSSGIAPDAVPNLNDPQQMASLLKGVGTAEKSPTDRAKFTDDVISQGVQASLSGQHPNTAEEQPETNAKYGTNVNGAPLTQADYFRTHSLDVLTKGDTYAEQTMPGDLAFKRAVRQNLQNYMSATIQNEQASHVLDNRDLMRGINGELTKGQPPETEQQLRAIPGMSDLLDKVATQDPKFAEGIPTMLAKVARQNVTTNSSNGYDTILRTLEPHGEDHPNAISSQDHLDRALGRSDGTGINMKDYRDAKPLIEADQTFKDTLSKHMMDITNANGNLDGKGQERSMAWFHQVMAAKNQNDSLGDKKLTDAQFIEKIGEKDGPPAPAPPSRMQQLENWASSLVKSKENGTPHVKTIEDYNAVPKGQKYIDLDGNVRMRK